MFAPWKPDHPSLLLIILPYAHGHLFGSEQSSVEF